MARRWGVQVEIVPGSPLTAVDLVVSGQADIAVGVSPRWDGADRVEYSQPYVRHGDRLMVPANSQVTTGFGDMLGTGWWIGYFADDSLDAENINKFAGIFNVSQNINEPFALQRESDAIYTMVSEENLDAIYGDNLRLLALVKDGGYENQVKILDTPYGDDMPITSAVPRNDADFRTASHSSPAPPTWSLPGIGGSAEDEAYHRFLSGQWDGLDSGKLPEQYRALAANREAAKSLSLLQNISDPLSRLIAVSVLVARKQADEPMLSLSADTASEQGWRKPLLVYLKVLENSAGLKQDKAALEKLRARIKLVEESL